MAKTKKEPLKPNKLIMDITRVLKGYGQYPGMLNVQAVVKALNIYTEPHTQDVITLDNISLKVEQLIGKNELYLELDHALALKNMQTLANSNKYIRQQLKQLDEEDTN